jgi:hypothetical protein
MSNQREDSVRRKYEELGWEVYHQGAPDFLLRRKKSDGSWEYQFCEVKGDPSHLYHPVRLLTKSQLIWKEALESMGAAYVVDALPIHVLVPPPGLSLPLTVRDDPSPPKGWEWRYAQDGGMVLLPDHGLDPAVVGEHPLLYPPSLPLTAKPRNSNRIIWPEPNGGPDSMWGLSWVDGRGQRHLFGGTHHRR